MRNTFINELTCLAESNPQIVLIVGDLGFSVVEPFARRFPERFINAGVAEQNMTGLAAGMASEGYHVFTYSIANFPTFRCAEQIRNDIDYHNLAVTVVAVGGGLAYGPLGYSHHAVQDYALIRTMPNMLIAAPSYQAEVRGCLRYLVDNPQPSYLRLGKSESFECFDGKVPSLSPGVWNAISFSDAKSQEAILCTGATLELVKGNLLTQGQRSAEIFTLPLWGMKFKELQPPQINMYQQITTVEDHLEDGGFGSWLAESLGEKIFLRERLRAKALSNLICGIVGDQETLNKKGGLV
jgi:transketolase